MIRTVQVGSLRVTVTHVERRAGRHADVSTPGRDVYYPVHGWYADALVTDADAALVCQWQLSRLDAERHWHIDATLGSSGVALTANGFGNRSARSYAVCDRVGELLEAIVAAEVAAA